jgi:hypothetical protein
MGEFKLMNTKDYFNFVNNSTYISNINTGQVIPPNIHTLQKPVQPMVNSKKMVYNSNNNNFTNNNMNINNRGIK